MTDPIDAALDSYGRMMRAIHVARAGRSLPWAELNITLPQLRTLSLLAAHDHGMSGRELAAMLGVGPSAVTPLIDRLVGHDLVRREEDLADRRITRLYITGTGLAILERMVAGQRGFMREVLSELSPTELATVDRAFALLYDAVQRTTAAVVSTPKRPTS